MKARNDDHKNLDLDNQEPKTSSTESFDRRRFFERVARTGLGAGLVHFLGLGIARKALADFGCEHPYTPSAGDNCDVVDNCDPVNYDEGDKCDPLTDFGDVCATSPVDSDKCNTGTTEIGDECNTNDLGDECTPDTTTGEGGDECGIEGDSIGDECAPDGSQPSDRCNSDDSPGDDCPGWSSPQDKCDPNGAPTSDSCFAFETGDGSDLCADDNSTGDVCALAGSDECGPGGASADGDVCVTVSLGDIDVPEI